MDHLTRRPLVTCVEGTLAEPQKADRIANRVRTILDRFAARRFTKRNAYNRAARKDYKKRLPQDADPRHRRGAAKTSKRLAPEKRLGTRMRQR